MKYRSALIFIAFFLTILISYHGFTQNIISIIPKPQEVIFNKGYFPLHNAKVKLPANEDQKRVAIFFAKTVLQQTGINLLQNSSSNTICFEYSKSIQEAEGYDILITTNKIIVTANNDKGLFWAVQSLRQLLPLYKNDEVNLPCMEIKDAPVYAWRSNMLDVSRHFFSVEYIKKHIDMLSYYKINTFHWHLTDDQGWRIEIKKYPQLTNIGAWRRDETGQRYGGYYTQDEIIDIVEYAHQRNVTIIPEIEMPGHCLAALASYPVLSCRKRSFEVANYWGVINDVYCAGDENTYTFIQDVLDEVLALFPSKYIHIGGDEVPKYRWQQCSVCQQKIKAEHLNNEQELQSYFIQRIQKYVESKGRILIGWDEILEGGVSSNAVVEVWRGPDKANEAIANKNKIIHTLYFDSPMSSLNLAKTFNFNPAVANHKDKVLGAECPLWTENITEYNADYMLYPRLQAFSELLWSGKTDFDDFKNRLKYHYAFMDKKNILYGDENKIFLNVSLKYIPEKKVWRLFEKHGIQDMVIRFNDGREDPDNKMNTFSDSITLIKPINFSVTVFRKEQEASVPIYFKIEDHKAIGIKPVFKTDCNKSYNKGGIYGMTDGILGSWNFIDGSWMGWWGEDMEMFVDLDSVISIHYLQINCMQQTQSWILLPKYVEFYISNDGQNWQQIAHVTHNISDQEFKPIIHTFYYKLPLAINARFVKVIATNYGQLPEWHNGAGKNAWVFADEMIIK
ncbi:MAG: family 20 glycosylhydrolase [Bacteroidota bacterium]